MQPFEISPANQADGTPTADAQQRHLQETMQTGSSRFEWLHRRLNGEDFPCEVLLQKMQLQGKTVVQAVIRDITDRKQAEAEAAQAKEQLQAILDGSPVAMIIARQTDAGPRAVYANQQFNQLTGYSIDESPSFEAFLKLVVPDSGRRHELTRHWRSLSDEAYGKGESIKAFQYEIRTKAGEIRYVSQSSTAVGDRQLLAFNDVTESQLVQAELAKAMKEAEAANQAKSAFLATMSHEIRTPMNAIINMTQLTLGTELNAKQKQYLTVVGYSARGLLALINDILDFSKVEAGKLDLETTPFSLRQLLDEVTDSFRGRVMEKQIEFVVHAEGNVPDRLIGDTLRLRQVLINLVGNAFKFTEDGEVILRIALVDPAASKTDGGPVQLRIGVKDSGIGISKEGQSKLFQSFSQVDASTPRKYGGTGLGLAICQKLVELMGGRLAVVSEEGEGSEFFFTGDFGCESWATTQRKLPDGIKDLQVLAIDDNDSTRELIKTVVEGFGMSCETAPDGADGLELLRQRNVENKDGRPFDLVVVDWIMPEMDGLEFCKAMRQQPATAGIPLIMISAFAGKAEEDKAKLFGVSAFIHKPLTASHLFDAFVGLYDNTHTASSYRDQKEDDEPVRADEFAGVRILMAEDNDANQFVAQEILEAVGFKLDIADNGRIAVEKLGECDEYTLVLMDMQMPEMDGLTATKEIRKRWPDRKLPIIALTANAMKGDLERCMEAGMDDYVSKPIDSKLLFKALRRWVPSNAPRATASEPDKAAEPAVETEEIPVVEGIDINDAIARLGLPWVSIRKMLFRFADGQPETLKELQAAMTSKDSEAARRHAHSIAGAGGNLSAIELRKRAKALELAIKDDTGGTEELFKSMNEELERVLGAINAIRPAPEAVAEPTNDQPVDAAALTEALGKLKTALEEGDMDGIESEAATCAKLGVPPALRRDMAKIGSLIEQYDYVTAAEVAERLIGHIKE